MASKEIIKIILSENKDKKIVIWGADVLGKLILQTIKEYNRDIEYFIDSATEKQGILHCNYEVFSPSKIKNLCGEYYIIIAVETYHSSIITTLNEWNYVEKQDYLYVKSFLNDITNIGDYKDCYENEIVGSPRCKDSKVVFKGTNNKLYIAEGVLLNNTSIIFHSDNGYCYIGKKSSYNGTIHIGENCKVKIGNQLTITHNCTINTAEATSITIGDDCMFASDNHIYSHDYHSILDIESKNRANPSLSVHIGNHVWLANEVVVLSGSDIGDGSVIGWRSLVKSKIPPNSVAVGNPAKVTKTGIEWDKKSLLL